MWGDVGMVLYLTHECRAVDGVALQCVEVVVSRRADWRVGAPRAEVVRASLTPGVESGPGRLLGRDKGWQFTARTARKGAAEAAAAFGTVCTCEGGEALPRAHVDEAHGEVGAAGCAQSRLDGRRLKWVRTSLAA